METGSYKQGTAGALGRNKGAPQLARHAHDMSKRDSDYAERWYVQGSNSINADSNYHQVLITVHSIFRSRNAEP